MANNGWIIAVGLCITLWGLMTFLPKLAVEQMSPTSCILYEVLGGVTVALVVLLWLGFRPEFEWRGAALSYVVGLCGFLGTLAYFYAVARGPVTIIATLSAFYPIIAIALGTIFLKEPITIKQMAGIALAFASMFLLAF